MTGAVRYRFGHDGQGRLVSVTDGDTTTIERDAHGKPTAITGPYGQRTGLATDPQGHLAKVSNPAGEAYRMEYSEDGLLARLTDPAGNASAFAYDALGRLLADTAADGGTQTLERAGLAEGYQVRHATALGRATVLKVEYPAAGGMRRTATAPDGTASTGFEGADGSAQSALADGTQASSQQAGDPRFQMMAPLTASQTVTTGGLTQTRAHTRGAVLTDASDPLSLKTLTDTVTVNGRTSTTVYDAASQTATATSAAGRTRTASYDSQGRPVKASVPGLLDITYGYDSHGRLSTATQGGRTATYAYDSQGRLASATDPLGRVSQTQYDAAGRPDLPRRPPGPRRLRRQRQPAKPDAARQARPRLRPHRHRPGRPLHPARRRGRDGPNRLRLRPRPGPGPNHPPRRPSDQLRLRQRRAAANPRHTRGRQRLQLLRHHRQAGQSRLPRRHWPRLHV